MPERPYSPRRGASLDKPCVSHRCLKPSVERRDELRLLPYIRVQSVGQREQTVDALRRLIAGSALIAATILVHAYVTRPPRYALTDSVTRVDAARHSHRRSDAVLARHARRRNNEL